MFTRRDGLPDDDVTALLDDREGGLWVGTRSGALEDFAQLIQRHQAHVFGILYRYERDYHKLEDLAQETFIKAW